MVSGLDSTIIDIIESHPSIIIGTCDRTLVPTVARGFGARLLSGGDALEVLVSCWPGPRTRTNIEETGRIAVTFTAPETFESYQIKGRVTEIATCTPEDLALAATFTEVIRARIVALGEPPELVRVTFAASGLFRVRVAPDAVFVQTPGKNAGERL